MPSKNDQIDTDEILRVLIENRVDAAKRTACNKKVKLAMRKLAQRHGLTQYDGAPGGREEWMGIDMVWWKNEGSGRPASQSAVLVGECELGTKKDVLEDFEKLPELKADIKLMVFACDEGQRKADVIIKEMERYLRILCQKTAGETYVALALGRGRTPCRAYELGRDRKFREVALPVAVNA